MTKRITTLHYKGKSFEIVFDGKYYLAIEHCYIDKNGKLTKTLNGFEMNAHDDVNDTINFTKKQIDIDELEAQGMDRVQATIQVYKLNNK